MELFRHIFRVKFVLENAYIQFTICTDFCGKIWCGWTRNGGFLASFAYLLLPDICRMGGFRWLGHQYLGRFEKKEYV